MTLDEFLRNVASEADHVEERDVQTHGCAGDRHRCTGGKGGYA